MSYSLFELNEFIRQVLALNLNEPIWVKCELAQVKLTRGHCYLDLVQKDDAGEEIIALGQAVVWALQLRSLRQKFGLELDPLLQEGMEVLMLVQVEFHERFGLKLMVQDFDPDYTLGKLTLKKRETLIRLEKEGFLEQNKKLYLPLVIQNIAILSSSAAAGLKDFINELEGNDYGYTFSYHLFPVAMQGNKVGLEIAEALHKINPARFDALVVIRGGGAKIDLAAFDEYDLCLEMATFSLPILTGIGHEVDETVLDRVAHTALKTPTAVASFLIQRNLQFESIVLQLGQEVKTQSLFLIGVHNRDLERRFEIIKHHSLSRSQKQSMMLDFIEEEVPKLLKYRFKSEKDKLNMLEKLAEFLGPEVILKRGFSITLKNGVPITDEDQLSDGDEIETILSAGKTKSIVKK